jgi:hypothetical protein
MAGGDPIEVAETSFHDGAAFEYLPCFKCLLFSSGAHLATELTLPPSVLLLIFFQSGLISNF